MSFESSVNKRLVKIDDWLTWKSASVSEDTLHRIQYQRQLINEHKFYKNYHECLVALAIAEKLINKHTKKTPA